jgi:hypothetical protein
VITSPGPAGSPEKSALNRSRNALTASTMFPGMSRDGTICAGAGFTMYPPRARMRRVIASPAMAATTAAAVSDSSYHAAASGTRRSASSTNDRAPQTSSNGATPITSTSGSPTSAQASTAATATGTHRRRPRGMREIDPRSGETLSISASATSTGSAVPA